MTSALRWAVMRAILMFHYCEGQSHQTVSTETTRFIRHREKGGMEVGGEGDYIPIATLPPPERLLH